MLLLCCGAHVHMQPVCDERTLFIPHKTSCEISKHGSLRVCVLPNGALKLTWAGASHLSAPTAFTSSHSSLLRVSFLTAVSCQMYLLLWINNEFEEAATCDLTARHMDPTAPPSLVILQDVLIYPLTRTPPEFRSLRLCYSNFRKVPGSCRCHDYISIHSFLLISHE